MVRHHLGDEVAVGELAWAVDRLRDRAERRPALRLRPSGRSDRPRPWSSRSRCGRAPNAPGSLVHGIGASGTNRHEGRRVEKTGTASRAAARALRRHPRSRHRTHSGPASSSSRVPPSARRRHTPLPHEEDGRVGHVARNDLGALRQAGRGRRLEPAGAAMSRVHEAHGKPLVRENRFPRSAGPSLGPHGRPPRLQEISEGPLDGYRGSQPVWSCSVALSPMRAGISDGRSRALSTRTSTSTFAFIQKDVEKAADGRPASAADVVHLAVPPLLDQIGVGSNDVARVGVVSHGLEIPHFEDGWLGDLPRSRRSVARRSSRRRPRPDQAPCAETCESSRSACPPNGTRGRAVPGPPCSLRRVTHLVVTPSRRAAARRARRRRTRRRSR